MKKNRLLFISLLMMSVGSLAAMERPKRSVVIGLRGTSANNDGEVSDYQDLYLIPSKEDVGTFVQIFFRTTRGNIVPYVPSEGTIEVSGKEVKFLIKEDTIYHLAIPWSKTSMVIIVAVGGKGIILKKHPEKNYINLRGRLLKKSHYKKKKLKRNKIIKLRIFSDWEEGR